jgi:PIN domain nuclease of toxin-antitoxin system
LWEIAMLVKKERISVDISFQNFIKLIFSSNKYQFQGITPDVAELSTQLPEEVNKDPADRIIAATSLIHNIPLVTKDSNLLKADSITTIW